MIKRRFAVSEGGRLAELPENETPADSGESLWVDVEDFAENELTAWLASLDFSQRAAHAATRLRGRPRTVSVSVGEEVLFEFPALASDIGSERVPLAFLCRPGLCVTVHRRLLQGTGSDDVTIDSNDRLKQNADGSFDLFVGPDESKIPAEYRGTPSFAATNPDKGLMVYFRFFGPLDPFFDKTWRLESFEIVN